MKGVFRGGPQRRLGLPRLSGEAHHQKEGLTPNELLSHLIAGVRSANSCPRCHRREPYRLRAGRQPYED
jgi:hypothetical protein